MPQLLYHHLVSHHLHYTKINEVYFSRAARAFGLSMIGIFIPIYLYNIGYSLSTIAIFFIITNIVRVLATPLAGYVLSRFGAKYLLAFGQIWAIAFLVLLMTVELNTALLLMTAVIWGIDVGLFWPAHHLDMSYSRAKSKTSRQVSMIFIVLSIANALGPLVGGIIATQFGIHYTLLFAIGFLLIASHLFWQAPGQAPKQQFAWQETFRNWLPMRSQVTANGANCFQLETAVNIWPLFIFLFLGTYQTVGIVVSLSLAITVLVIYFIGRRGDQGKNWQQLTIGSKTSSLVHLTRPLAQTLGGATSINLLHDITSHLHKVPFTSYYYEHASVAPNRLEYIVRMEIAAGGGMLMSWLLLLVFALLLPLQLALISAFVFAAIAVLFIGGVAKFPVASSA